MIKGASIPAIFCIVSVSEGRFHRVYVRPAGGAKMP